MLNSYHLYSLLLGTGAFIGLWRIFNKLHPSQALKGLGIGVWTLGGSLIGARAVYVLTHMEYYSIHPSEIPALWFGGLDEFGAIAGGILFAAAASKLLHMRALKTLDLISRMILPLGTAAWIGCWVMGTAYGQPLAQGTWWGMTVLDESGAAALRVPLQPAAILSLFVFLFLVEKVAQKSTNGILFSLTGLVLSLHTLLFSLMRADPRQTLFTLQWLSLDTFLFSISSLGFAGLIGILLLRGSKKDTIKMQGHKAEVEP